MAKKKSKGSTNASGSMKKERYNFPWLTIIVFTFVLGAIGILVPVIVKNAPAFVQSVFTEGIFKGTRKVFGCLPSLTYLSVTEISLFVIVLALFICLVVFFVRLFSGKVRFVRIISTLLVIVFAATIILNLFNITYGLNYYNTKMYKHLQLNVQERSVTQLYGLCVYLRSESNRLRSVVDENENGVFELQGNGKIKGKELYLYYVADEFKDNTYINRLGYEVTPAKYVYSSFLMSVCGISGIYMPFFEEANVNVSQPSLLIPATAAHECSHSIGYAREDEANFAAYMICRESKDPNIAYSGYVLALMEAANELYKHDVNMYKELLLGYSEGLMRDIEDYNAYWDNYRGKISEFSNKVNDTYLKYNGSESGVESYGEMVDLLLAQYAKDNGH